MLSGIFRSLFFFFLSLSLSLSLSLAAVMRSLYIYIYWQVCCYGQYRTHTQSVSFANADVKQNKRHSENVV